MKLFTINNFGTKFEVHSTYHTYQAREGQSKYRMEVYTITKLREILNTAAQSISQYRNKGKFTITFNTHSGRVGALLVAFTGNNLTIITVLYNVKRHVNDVFHGVPHYYLRGFLFHKPTKQDIISDRREHSSLYMPSKKAHYLIKQENNAFKQGVGTTTRKPKWKD